MYKDIPDLSEFLRYNPNSPSGLEWTKNIYSGRGKNILMAAEGDFAGYITGMGYWNVQVNGEGYRAHRVVWKLKMGEMEPDMTIDHVNKNKTDNRLENLRKVSMLLNNRNNAIKKKNSFRVGVKWQVCKKYGYTTCVAHWSELDGKRKAKAFSVDKYGVMVAYRNAVLARTNALLRLNFEGAGYTNEHFK